MTPAAALAPVTPVLAHLAAPCVGQAVKGFLLLRIQAGNFARQLFNIIKYTDVLIIVVI